MVNILSYGYKVSYQGKTDWLALSVPFSFHEL